MTQPQAEPKKQPRIKIDGKDVEFQPGDTIMRAAERAGVSKCIPRYCYHPGLPIAATCRMCTVEVEKAPKLMTACSTPAADGMVVLTNSERVRKSHQGVMEFLLLNHPLDCPVCDQAGECDLQDYNYEYGPGSSRFVEGKRVWEEATTKTLSEDVVLNMNRCVHCERCVRFTEAITKTNELLMVNRGWKKELVTAGDEGMHNDYQGCVVDICPVGALTFTDFRFQKRVWFLKSMPSVCDRCSKGCNISVDQEKNIIYRYRPEYNAKVNGHWMCDEGRKSYHDSMNPDRGVTPALKEGSELSATTWDQAAVLVSQSLKQAKKVMVVIGTDTTTEEAQALMDDLPKLCTGTVDFRFHNGTDGVTSSDDDEPLDTILRRKDKTPNTKGLEALGLKPWKSSSADVSILVRFMRAGVPKEKTGTIEIALGAWKIAELESRKVHAFLPGLVTAEKAGSYTNCDGVIQTFKPAVKHTGDGRTFADMLNVLKLAKGLK